MVSIKQKVIVSLVLTALIIGAILWYSPIWRSSIIGILILYVIFWPFIALLTFLRREDWRRIFRGVGQGMGNAAKNIGRITENAIRQSYEREQREREMRILGESIARGIIEGNQKRQYGYGYKDYIKAMEKQRKKLLG
jgi:prepilin signal peptidase PulO-like enzyme (type II secretory pathway)